jgi:hypothetical protein
MTELINKRTVRFHGIGFGETPAEIRVIYRPPNYGYEVFYTTVPTINAHVPGTTEVLDPQIQQVVFTIQLPVDFSGQVPMSIHCTKGTAVVVTGMDANYCYEDSLNPRYTAEDRSILDNPMSSAADRARVWRSRATPPFDNQEEAIIDAYVTNPTKETYQATKIFFQRHGLGRISSGPDGFRNTYFEGDARLNCCINDVPIDDSNKRESIEKAMTWPGKLGTFERTIPLHSTLTFDLAIVAGME